MNYEFNFLTKKQTKKINIEENIKILIITELTGR